MNVYSVRLSLTIDNQTAPSSEEGFTVVAEDAAHAVKVATEDQIGRSWTWTDDDGNEVRSEITDASLESVTRLASDAIVASVTA